MMVLETIQTLVKQRSGLNCDFDLLREAVSKRQTLLAKPQVADYLALLNQETSEFDELVALLTNNETYFFREADQYPLLLETLIPELLATRTRGQVIRILSAGCSSGAEPYSIAIALLEKFGETTARLFNIVGVDIDQAALSKAMNASYGAYSFRALPDALRARYFSPAGETRYVLSDKVRSLARFQQVNLLVEPPPSLCGFDVVFFRNVSIYFDEATRYAILKNLYELMQETGYLFVGNTETLANDLGVFELQECAGLFYFSKGVKQKKLLSSGKNVTAATFEPASPPVYSPGYPSVIDQLFFSSNDASNPALLGADAEVRQKPHVPRQLMLIRSLIADQMWDSALLELHKCAVKDQALLLLEAWIRLQTKDIAIAEQLALDVYQQNEWSLEAAFLLGLIAKMQNKTELAIRWLKRAVYINPGCWVAHYYLAELYRYSKAYEPARRGYKLVLQALSSKDDVDGGLLIPVGLPVAEIHFLCKRHLDLLEMPEQVGNS